MGCTNNSHNTTQGPEIRTGSFPPSPDGLDVTIRVSKGDSITLHTSADYKHTSTCTDLYISYPQLTSVLSLDSKVLLDDGKISLSVQALNEELGQVVCAVDNAGVLKSRRGVNLPNAILEDLPALNEQDKELIRYGLEHDMIDILAASFIRNLDGVLQVKEFVNDHLFNVMKLDRSTTITPMIVSKVSERSERALRKTRIRATTKPTHSIHFAPASLGAD